MKSIIKATALSAMFGIGMAATASAGEVDVTGPIASSTTWTADNFYNLQGQVYVLAGATLTIEAGTVIASDPGGSLAIVRGAQIIACGTKAKPIVFTSVADRSTWEGDNPHTGIWREASNEWGNLTIMGRAFISEDAIGANSSTCAAGNVGDMEGLTNGPSTDRYGGGQDNDDSGSLKYCTFRYGGKVVGLNNELNGLSLGGIGRGTDIHHIEIMNNVDDGVEIWGGTVNLKYISIWNVGDDSFDVDQGWRGKAQFVLIVQGYSTRSAQGSGTGDNCFETDGAEQSDYQPVTTATIYNATVIGQPASNGGDHGTAWRDNARVQYRNSIFMDLGARVVSFDNVDGDGGNGYGFGGTLTWPLTWSTAFNGAPAHANDCPAGTYQSQINGNLAEIRDTVFWNNNAADAYTEAIARGVFTAPNFNVAATAQPIRKITRAPAINYLGLTMSRVIELDPRPAAEALVSVGTAPNDGFFTQAAYRGAFHPRVNWLQGWSASDAYGFLCATGKISACPPGASDGGQQQL